jgi:hypothetical protein
MSERAIENGTPLRDAERGRKLANERAEQAHTDELYWTTTAPSP